MGRWAARFAEKLAVPPQGGTVKTDERGVLSVLAVPLVGGAVEIRGTDAEPVLSELEAARLQDRRARLLRWGWPEAAADQLAARLARRDREADPRASCADCGHFRPWRCGNHRRAGLHAPEAGRDLASLLQRCPGFAEREGGR